MRVDSLMKTLDATFGRAKKLEPYSQVQADVAKYLCVLVSGFLEQALASILVEYTRTRADPTVLRYVEGTLRRPGNMNAERITQLVGRFDELKRAKVEAYMSDERKDAINSVHGNRVNIAHGVDVGLTYPRVERYYKHVRDTVRFIQSEFA